MNIIQKFENLNIFSITNINVLQQTITNKNNINIATDFLHNFKIYLSGKYLLIIAYLYNLKDEFFNTSNINLLHSIINFIENIKNKNYDFLYKNETVKMFYDIKLFIDKSKIDNLKLLVDKYIDIKSNLFYIYNNYNPSSFVNNKYSDLIESLNKQKDDIVNLGKKYYNNLNQDFYDKIYDISQDIKNKVDDNYWKIIVHNMLNNNFELFNLNISDIINKLKLLNPNFIFNLPINPLNHQECISNLFILINELSKLSSPIRDLEYKIFYDIINNDNNDNNNNDNNDNKHNYYKKLCLIVKNIYVFIDKIYSDLFIISL
jgi:hypothetical protein